MAALRRARTCAQQQPLIAANAQPLGATVQIMSLVKGDAIHFMQFSPQQI